MKVLRKLAFRHVPVDLIDPPEVRIRLTEDPERLKRLATSIKRRGLQQPILVRPRGKRFQLIAGSRRLNAFKALGWKRIPAFVVDQKAVDAVISSLIENIEREELDPISEAYALGVMLEQYHMSHKEIAEEVGRSEAWVSNRLRLLLLPREIRDQVMEGRIDPSTALELLRLQSDELATALAEREGISPEEAKKSLSDAALAITRAAVERKLTREKVRVLVRSHIARATAPPPGEEEEKEEKPMKYKCVKCQTLHVMEVMQSVLLCPDCYERLMTKTY